jgi:hypothetical protein
MKINQLLRCALPSQGQGTIAFDPTFGSFTLLELVSQLHESVSLVKVFRLFKLEQMFFGVQSVHTVGSCTTSDLLWQGQHVCDALFCFVKCDDLRRPFLNLCVLSLCRGHVQSNFIIF